MLQQSLQDQIKFATNDSAAAKKGMSESTEKKATAEGDLAVSSKELANAESAQQTLNGDCQTAAADHEASMKGRAEELKALAEAKEIITSKTGGAESYQYSLLQTSSKLHSRADLVNMEIVTLVKKLAKEQHSSALAQLASKISVVMRYGSAGGDDVFGKVKTLIRDLIDKLEAEAASEAKQKAYCDEQMAKTAEKKAELDADIAKLTNKIDVAAARSAKLKEEVATLQSELAALAKQQAEMDQTRADEKAAFAQAKADLEEGISGIQGALSILREYYGSSNSASLLQDPLELAPAPELAPMHSKAEGAGNSIVGILEVIESDFSKSLAEETVAEEEAQSTYEKVSQENKITKAMREQDVKYKTQEATSLDKEIAENTSDKEGLLTELSAVLEYSEKLNEMCIAKPETYEERSKRRQAEIAGLKEALNILNGEAFLQRHSQRRLRYTPVN
jgi:chromosome segregation ATPase